MAVHLKNLNCILTGASRGLGASIAAALWARGANLLLAGKNPERLESRRRALGPATVTGQTVRVCHADLASPESAGHITDVARKDWEQVDGLVNNAAIQGPIGPLWENSWEDWTETIQVNLMAPVALCKLVMPWMAESGGGSIVNLSGGGATGPRPRFSAYATAKAGLVRFSETLSREAAPLGIRVNCVAPGSLKTDMLQDMLSAGRDRMGDAEHDRATRCESGGGDSLERAAELIAFLVSAESAGITGRLVSAVWDPWPRLADLAPLIQDTDLYTLRRIIPSDRGLDWDEKEPRS